MFSSLASVSKSKPSTSKSSLIVQSFDTFAALTDDGYALTDKGNTVITDKRRLYLILSI